MYSKGYMLRLLIDFKVIHFTMLPLIPSSTYYINNYLFVLLTGCKCNCLQDINVKIIKLKTSPNYIFINMLKNGGKGGLGLTPYKIIKKKKIVMRHRIV